MDDFETVDTKPWRLWHSFGLFVPNRGCNGETRPWTLQDEFWQIFVADDAAHVFFDNLTQQYLRDVLDEIIFYAQWVQGISVFVLVVALVWLVATELFAVKIENDKTVKVKRD